MTKLASGDLSVDNYSGHFSFFLATQHLNPLPMYLGYEHMTKAQPFKHIQPRVAWAMSNSISSDTGESSWLNCGSPAGGFTTI